MTYLEPTFERLEHPSPEVCNSDNCTDQVTTVVYGSNARHIGNYCSKRCFKLNHSLYGVQR